MQKSDWKLGSRKTKRNYRERREKQTENQRMELEIMCKSRESELRK